jgi:hypothetical protein
MKQFPSKNPAPNFQFFKQKYAVITIKNPMDGIRLEIMSCNSDVAAAAIRVIGVIKSAKLIFFMFS